MANSAYTADSDYYVERDFLEQTKILLSRFEGVANDLVHMAQYALRVEIQRAGLNQGGAKLLHWAAMRGWCSGIELLLKHGADINAGRPGSGMTPLFQAATSRRYDAVVMLIDAGARIDQLTVNGRSPLHMCAINGQESMCKLLMSRGASLDTLVDVGAGRHFERDLIDDVRSAGGWNSYVAAPRAELLAFRRELPSLRESGRATPSTVPAHERLFLAAKIPDDAFSHILSFWRTSRDYSRI